MSVDVLREEASQAGLDVVAWIVGAHNTFLGARHRECAIENAFGNRYVHSLSPAHADVRAYLIALASDIAAHGPAAIELKSFGYLGFRHGFHHEITGVDLSEAEEILLGLPFGPAELALANQSGCRRTLGARVSCTHPHRGVGVADRRRRDGSRTLLESNQIQRYLEVLRSIEASLVIELAAAVRVVAPATEVRVIAGPEPVLRAVAPHVDGVVAPYPQRLEAIRDDVQRLRSLGIRTVFGGYRAIAPLRVTSTTANRTVAAWRDAGADGLNVYNYGLITRHALGLVGRALRRWAT